MAIIHVQFLVCRFGDGDLIDLGFWWGWRPKRWIMWTWVVRYAAYMCCKGQGDTLNGLLFGKDHRKSPFHSNLTNWEEDVFATGSLTDEVRIDTCQPRKLTKQQHGDAHDLRSSKIVVESPTLFWNCPFSVFWLINSPRVVWWNPYLP